jgi:hypothetical protein
MPLILESCDSSVVEPDKIVEVAGIEDSDDEDEMPTNFKVHTSLLDEKTRACEAIGTIANEVGPAFIPFVFSFFVVVDSS